MEKKKCKSMDFKNLKIICRERNWSKRLFSEMFNIDFHDNTINRMSDCNGFQYVFNMEHVYREGVPQESKNQGGVKYDRFKGGGQICPI